VQFTQGAEGTPGAYFTVNMVAGRPNEDLALRFIDISISPEAQSCFAERMRYSPTNRRAELSPDVAADVVAGEEAQAGLIRFDPTVIDQNRSDWTEAWNRAIAR
jgi:putative spermidine/putrescine transport system substrate-binding protein